MTTRVEQGAAPRAEAAAAQARPVQKRPEARFERLRAPFSLRCGALLVDYTVPVSVIALSTLMARALGGNTEWWGYGLLTLGYIAATVLAILNFIALPVFTGRTVGKWVTDLRIERTDGGRLSYGRSILRHVVGYALTVATLGLGFLLAAFTPSGRALHDFIAGTAVVRDRSVARRKKSY